MEYTDLAVVKRLSETDAELAKVSRGAERERALRLTSQQLLKPDAPPAQYPPLEAGRAQMLDHDTRAFHAMQKDDIAVSTKMIPMRDGFQSEIQIVAPKHVPAEGAPLVVIYFGGGFMFGNNRQCANYATAICRLCKAVVVLPSYRLAPEHPFPVGPNDAWDSFVWIAANARQLGADPSRGFIVGGRSAGATLSAVIVQKSLLDGEYSGPSVTGTWLSVPVLLTEKIVPESERHLWISREQNKDSPVFNGHMCKIFMRTWNPDELSPMFSPFNAGPRAHQGLPPTYLQVCGTDPLRDDSLLYERTLRCHGVKTMLDVYPGVPHAVTTPYPQLPAARKYQIDVVDRVGQLLGIELDRKTIAQVFPW